MTETARPVIKCIPNKCGPSSLSRKLKSITTPQPFKLSSDECLTKHRNCKHDLIKREMEERQKNMELEHLKQFRANPVPAHTFLPLFLQIQMEKAQKREITKEKVKVQLIAKQKPFDLSCYKEPVRRCLSTSDLNSDATEKPEKNFRATPLPKNHKVKPLLEIMAEQEILREIRLRRRAEQLIKSSVLPFSIPRDTIKKHKIEDGIAKERTVKSAPSVRKTKQQHSIRTNTVKFEIPPELDKILPNSRTNNSLLKSALKCNEIVNLRRSASISALDCPTPRMTYGAILREQANRNRCKESSEIEYFSSEKQKKYLKMKRDLLAKITLNKPSISKEERMQRFREDTKARMKEYHQEMNKMSERVMARPFLVERQSQLSAIHKLDKTFRELLERQGLDEEFIFANSKPVVARNCSLPTSDESENESTGLEDGSAKRTRSKGNTTPSESSNYSTDANTDDQSHTEAEEMYGNNSERGSASESELPERDVS